MTGVERHTAVHFSCRRHNIGGKTRVIFHIPRTLQYQLAFKLLEQIKRVFTHDIDQYIKTATMSHANHDLLGAVLARALNNIVDSMNQAFSAFQAKTFCTRIFSIQMLFQPLSRTQSLQNMKTRLLAVIWLATTAFNSALYPLLLFKVHNGHVFITDRGTVNTFQIADYFCQRLRFLLQ